MLNDLFFSKKIEYQTLRRVLYGIWILCAAVIIFGVWFVHNKPAYIFGELIGSLIASLLMLHLYHCIDVELDLGETKSVAHSRINSILRITIEIIAVVGCFFISSYINPFTLLIGLFGRKLAAVAVPFVFDRKRNGTMLAEDMEADDKENNNIENNKENDNLVNNYENSDLDNNK